MYWIGAVAFALAALVVARAYGKRGKLRALESAGKKPPDLRPEFAAMRGIGPLFAIAMMGLGTIILLLGFFATAGGGVLSLGSLVGFLAVFGIAARNGILLITHFQRLEREEGMEFGPELVLRGAMERLAPILMTASATGLALVPLVVSGSIPGHEIEHPMAIVILGGLLTATLLNLLVLPSLYLRFGRSKRQRVATRAMAVAA